jgi:hypothetical protein
LARPTPQTGFLGASRAVVHEPHEGALEAAHFACPLANALATVLTVSLTGFDPSPKPASGRRKGSSPFDGSLRPDEPPVGRQRPPVGR